MFYSHIQRRKSEKGQWGLGLVFVFTQKNVTAAQTVQIWLNLLLMWQHSLGLSLHAFCPESESLRCQYSFNNKSITSCTLWTSTSLFQPHKSRSSHPHQSPLAPVRYSHLSTGCLNYFISVSPFQHLPDFLFLSPFHYLVNMWLGHKSETDLWAHLSVHPNASWHAAPYYLLLQGAVILAGPPACLSACPSFQPQGFNEGQIENRHSALHFSCF